jgi:hypothetical protein
MKFIVLGQGMNHLGHFKRGSVNSGSKSKEILK